jgi:hypothetical protein
MKFDAVNSLRIKGMLMTLAVAVTGCGSDTAPLPPDATIEVSPSSKEWVSAPNNQTDANGVTHCVVIDDFYQDELVSVRVLDGQGRAIEDAELIFSLNLAENTFSGHPVLSLYNDLNKNFVADPGELVSSAENDLFITTTEAYTGSKYVIVRMNLSCPYDGELRVYSEGISGSASFLVSAE